MIKVQSAELMSPMVNYDEGLEIPSQGGRTMPLHSRLNSDEGEGKSFFCEESQEVWKGTKIFVKKKMESDIGMDNGNIPNQSVVVMLYRQLYRTCFPSLNLGTQVVDHIRNRRFARAFGWNYVRLLHVDRSLNTSSGRGEEYDVVNFKNPDVLKRFSESTAEISYADPADLLKMLNIKVDAFPLNNLRDNLHLFYGRNNKS
jgi:hypothetical protein